MDNINKMNRTKPKLSDLNPHLMCVLCGGYYIDATTIVECLHSFCRSCIVKHLESSKYCPICEVQVHKTKPLVNIRPDKTLQDIVYKLVPGLFANEMRSRRKFYRERPHYMKPNDSESVGEVSDESMIYINDENITLSLDYHKSGKQVFMENSFQEISTPVKGEKRYFKCPTGVTVYHLQKLLKAKYDLNDNNYKVEIYFKDQPLHKEFTLLDISYIYLWKNQKGTLDLTFKIFENVVKRQKIEEVESERVFEVVNERTESEQPCKEVKIEPRPLSPVESKVEPMTVEPVTVEPLEGKEVKSELTVVSLLNNCAENHKNPVSTTEDVKQNGVITEGSKEVQLQISESGVMSVSQIENGDVIRTVEECAPKISDNLKNKSNTGIVPDQMPKSPVDGAAKQERMSRLIPEHSRQAPKSAKPYKTIRCSPKSWNPVIPKEKLRPTLMKNSDEPKKPLKFFKMRNMPRFLGNPASGVRPVYAESSEKDGSERRAEERKDNSKALKNILKIDPKTLRPIEKEEMPIISTPSTPNLLTNPFIPNNNHFLFSDPLLLHPNAGKSEKHNNNNNINSNHNNNFNNNGSSSGSNNSNNNSNGKPSGSSRPPLQNGSFPPICFPTPDYCSNFFPYQTSFPKPNYYPSNEKIDPLIRASRLSPFANLSGFSMAGFHASLPPSISLLLKHQSPHHHFKKLNHFPDKKSVKDESTKDSNKNCDDNSLKVAVANDKSKEAVAERIAVGCELGKSADVKKQSEEKETEECRKKMEEKEEATPPKKEETPEKEKDNLVGDAAKEGSNSDNSIDESSKSKERACDDVTSACTAEAKPESVDNNDKKYVNDKER